MDHSRLSQGQMISAIAGVILFISLFLKWFGAGPLSLSGWESQNTLDIYLFILAAFAIIPAAMEMSGNSGDLPYLNTENGFLLSVIGLILTTYVVLDVPDGASRKIGLWLAEIAVIAIVYGQFTAMNEEGARR